jgi:hypothetical protein
MAIRILGLLAVLGGVGVAIAAGHFVGLALNAPTVRPWSLMTDPTRAPLIAVVGNLGIAAIAVATGGLVFRSQNRISNGAALAGSIGSMGGLLGSIGAYVGFLLPVGSSLLVWDLARVRAVRRWLAVAHIASAVAFLVPLAAMLTNAQLGVGFVLTLVYPLTWVAIGASMLRGEPILGPAAPGARPRADSASSGGDRKGLQQAAGDASRFT